MYLEGVNKNFMDMAIIILSCISIWFSVTALIFNVIAHRDNQRNIKTLLELYKMLREDNQFLQNDINDVWEEVIKLHEDEEDDSST